MFGRFNNRHLVFEKLLERGVLIREVGPDGFMRVCMGTDEEMETFRTAFLPVLDELNASGL